jgi:hypothetical protein
MKTKKEKAGIFTTNEDNVFVLYPYQIETIMEDEHEIFVEAEIFLGPNETSNTDEYRLGLAIPISREWYDVATKIIDLYKNKLENELSEIGRKEIKINPQ